MLNRLESGLRLSPPETIDSIVWRKVTKTVWALKLTRGITGTGDYISVFRLCPCCPPIVSQALRIRVGIQEKNAEFGGRGCVYWGRVVKIQNMNPVNYFMSVWAMERHKYKEKKKITRRMEKKKNVSYEWKKNTYGVWSNWRESTWNYAGRCL